MKKLASGHYKSINKFEQFGQNPFVDAESSLPKKVKKNIYTSTNQAMINMDSGEIGAQVSFYKIKEVDNQEFTKIYNDQLQKIFGLQQNASKVLSYIMSVTPINKDQIFFQIEECKKYTGYSSSTTILDGLASLLENQIIARTDYSYLYFINPFVFFNGDRINLIKSYKRKGKKLTNPNQIEIPYNELPASENNSDN